MGRTDPAVLVKAWSGALHAEGAAWRWVHASGLNVDAMAT
jgi:hypothetical protein